jgi:hypothetical protein
MDFRQVDKSTVNAKLLRFAKYCDDLAFGAEMPLRSAFEVRNAHWLFGFITTLDVLEGGGDFRFTYCGDFWKVALNYDMTGWRLSEAEACGRLVGLRPNYDAAIKARAPRYRFGKWVWPDGRFVRIERLVVPFAGENGEVAMIAATAQCEKSFAEIVTYNASGVPRLVLEFSTSAMAAA